MVLPGVEVDLWFYLVWKVDPWFGVEGRPIFLPGVEVDPWFYLDMAHRTMQPV